ncbi:hypothetical protein DRO91_01000 [Candidatus Heimdallarchaeota archaeon]|nr:MAG: hypothetical protein DRO91_01000 [Candidatus Heimdallarchaeota archaeon]
MTWTIADSKLVYGVNQKDLSHLDISSNGKLELVIDGKKITFEEIVRHFCTTTKYQDCSFAIRLPQLIVSQIKKLFTSFRVAREKYSYKGSYHPIYPIKVNHSKFIIDTIRKAHPNYAFESGTKSEFILLKEVLKDEKHRLIMCNGNKDHEFLEEMKIAIREGYTICLSIESVQELKDTLTILPRKGFQLAFRIKPYVSLHGHWGTSSSRHSKFGLAIGELVEVMNLLKERKATSLLTTLHAHPGSQITSLHDIENYAHFMATVFRLLHENGLTNLRAINFGGGLPIDYDNRLDSLFMKKYADILVKVLAQELPALQPELLTESGRAITALSTIVVVKTIDRYAVFPESAIDEQLKNHFWSKAKTLLHAKSSKEVLANWQQWEDSQLVLDSLQHLHDFEHVTLLLKRKLREEFFQHNDYLEYLNTPAAKSLLKPEYTVQGNFSIFNSICDLVLVSQYFPVIPLNNLHLQPETLVRLFDITCDSDGVVDVYNAPVSEKKLATKDHFQLTFPKELTLGGIPVGKKDELIDSYFVIPLAGAYQDIIEFDHNLLGDLPDVLVTARTDWQITLLTGAESIGDILEDLGYHFPNSNDPYFDNGGK